MPGDKASLEEIIESWLKLPKVIRLWAKNVLFCMFSLGVFIGCILVIWGAIKWATNYGRGGNEIIIKGIALIIISWGVSLIGGHFS